MSSPLSVDLSGKTAVVTGSRAGIGRAIAEQFIASGARVVGMQRRPAEGLGPNYRFVEVDLSVGADLRSAAAVILSDGPVDILVNNAGINIRHKFEHFPRQDWNSVMQVNLRAVVELTQVFGAPMLERGNGTIINIASMLSFTGGLTASAYAASKGAVGQLTKSIANEWASRGVVVNAIAPGFIDTDMNVALRSDEVRDRQIQERIPAGRWGHPDDIAGAALFLASDAARYVHGTVLPVDGGYLAR